MCQRLFGPYFVGPFCLVWNCRPVPFSCPLETILSCFSCSNCSLSIFLEYFSFSADSVSIGFLQFCLWLIVLLIYDFNCHLCADDSLQTSQLSFTLIIVKTHWIFPGFSYTVYSYQSLSSFLPHLSFLTFPFYMISPSFKFPWLEPWILS